MSLMDAMLLEGYRDPSDVYIALRADGLKGSGTIDDPYDGSSWDRLDSLLRGIIEDDIAIHFGPGLFETKGNAAGDPSQGWKVRRGWKIIGSGIDVTVLKVVGATNGSYFAIGTKAYGEFAERAEVLDLTVDCNMPGNPNTCVAAIALNGSHTCIRRVKAINWGTETASAECFVLAVGGVHPDLLYGSSFTNGVIEDCICVQPHENNLRETTVIHCFGSDNPFDHRWAFNQSPVLRRNFVDCGFSGGRSSFILTVKTLARSGAVATCETYRPHGRETGQRTTIARTSDSSHSGLWFGYFTVTKVDDYRFTYTMAGTPTESAVTGVGVIVGTGFQALSMGGSRSGLVEDNIVRNAWVGGPYQDTYHTREVVVRRNLYQNVGTAHYTNMGKLSEGPKDIESIQMVSPTKAEVTITNHGLANGEFVNVRKVSKIEYNAVSREVQNRTDDTFEYESLVGLVSGASGGIVERTNAGISTVAHIGSGTAEATTSINHQLGQGDRIKVSNATQSSTDFTPKNEYNGLFEITTVPAANKFRYLTNGVPSGNAFNSTYQRAWGVDRLVVEDNVIELREAFSYEYGFPIAIAVLDEALIDETTGLPPFVHGEIVIRRNVIRFVGGAVNSALNALGIYLTGAKSIVIEENIVDLANSAAIRHDRCGAIRYFNNRTSVGNLVRGYGSGGTEPFDEIQDLIEGSILL